MVIGNRPFEYIMICALSFYIFAMYFRDIISGKSYISYQVNICIFEKFSNFRLKCLKYFSCITKKHGSNTTYNKVSSNQKRVLIKTCFFVIYTKFAVDWYIKHISNSQNCTNYGRWVIDYFYKNTLNFGKSCHSEWVKMPISLRKIAKNVLVFQIYAKIGHFIL